MHQTDFEDFSKTLHKLAVVFTKKLSDEFIQAYWDALKDEPLSTVIRLADQHTRYGKFFPKPVELRPKEEKPPKSRDLEGEAKFREGEARAIANLEELRRQDPVAWRAEVEARYNARLIATQPTSSILYAEGLKNWQKTVVRN